MVIRMQIATFLSMSEQRQENVLKHFYKRLERDGVSSCHLWSGPLNHRGYGMFSFYDGNQRRTIAAHQLSYFLTYGEPPLDKPMILHSCDVRACVNPFHLRAGTHIENMDEMTAKGRRPIGEKAGRAVLTVADVLEIRASPMSHAYFSRRFKVDKKTIRSIRNRENWKHVP